MKLDAKLASLDALDAVKSKQARICPLICEHGFRASGERCEKIVCRAGYAVGDDNTCEKIEPKKPVAKRDAPAAEPKRSADPPKAQAGGQQIICSLSGRAGRLPRVVGLLAREVLACLAVPIEKSAIDRFRTLETDNAGRGAVRSGSYADRFGPSVNVGFRPGPCLTLPGLDEAWPFRSAIGVWRQSRLGFPSDGFNQTEISRY